MRTLLRLFVWASMSVGLFSATATDAWACTVCYGAADAPVIDGMNWSIVFMLSLTYFLMVGIAGTFVAARLKANRSQTAQAQGENVR